MNERQKERGSQVWLKAAGVAFAVYLVSFGVFMWMDDHGMISRPAPVIMRVFYLPLMIFYGLVSWCLK